jgi:hypothetical protein
LDDAITAWTSARGMEEVLAALEAAEVPAGRIYSVADIVEDPHYLAREMILPSTLPGGIAVKMPGITPKLSETPGGVRWQAPTLGEHTDEVLHSLGLAEREVQRLRREGPPRRSISSASSACSARVCCWRRCRPSCERMTGRELHSVTRACAAGSAQTPVSRARFRIAPPAGQRHNRRRVLSG